MTTRVGLILIASLMAMSAVGIWRHLNAPRTILSTGSVVVESRRHPGTRITVKTREVDAGGVRLTEAELPGGTWIDCRGDCAETIRREHLEFWESQREKSR